LVKHADPPSARLLQFNLGVAMSLPDPPEALKPTVASTPKGPPPSAPRRSADVPKAKVGFVEGPRPRFSDETSALLRTRLEAASLALSIILAVVFVQNLFAQDVPLLGLRLLIVLGFVGSYLVLRSRRQLSLTQLRGFEVGLFGAIAAQLLLMMHARLTAFAAAGDAVSVVAAEQMYLSAWGVAILTYGILMPNTWPRAAAVLLPTACLPYLLLFWMRLQTPAISEALAADHLEHWLPVPFVAALIAVFAASVIHSVRREAFESRQLGQYFLKKKLGSGGMGEVYQAEHQMLKRPCAIKLIKPGKKADAAALAGFER
jgi:eukaryotic-like serine/threonine-protein kinase